MALVPYSDSEGSGDEAAAAPKAPAAMQTDTQPIDLGKRAAPAALAPTEPKRSRLPPPSFTGEVTAPTFINTVEHQHEAEDEEEEEALPVAVALMPPQVRFRKPNRVTEDREALGLRSQRQAARKEG